MHEGAARLVEVRVNSPSCGVPKTSGESPMDKTAELLSDCEALIVEAIGPCGRRALERFPIRIYERGGPVDSVLERVIRYEKAFRKTGESALR